MSQKKKNGAKGYEVGYGRPPRQHRFKPGQSGNPRGRPKGARGLKADLLAELGDHMSIQIAGKPITATKQRLMVKTLTARAATGDVKAINCLLPYIMKILGPDDLDKDNGLLSASDQRLLDDLMRDLDRGNGGGDES